MNKYFPSKKFLLILFSIVVALGIIYFFNELNKNKITNVISKQEIENKRQEFMVLDSDNDGLKDWEEILWRTDPNNPDTDGDGTSDGDEVKLNRDPLIPNTSPAGQTPNDIIDPQLIELLQKKEEEFIKLSKTERFSRELFSEYIVAKNNSKTETLNSTAKQEILDDMINRTSGVIINKYTTSDLIISSDMSIPSLKEYGNKLGEILLKYSTNGTGEELNYILYALEKEDPKLLDKLSPIIINYDGMIKDLLKVAIPKDLANTQVKILNNYYNIKVSLENIQTFFADAANGVASLQTYQNSFNSLFLNIESLRKDLWERGVVFTDDDIGYLFINTLQQ